MKSEGVQDSRQLKLDRIQRRRLHWLGHEHNGSDNRIPEQARKWHMEGFCRGEGGRREEQQAENTVTSNLREMALSWDEGRQR